MTCDICLATYPELWCFSVAAFNEPIANVNNVAGEWAVCDACKVPVISRDVAGIIARVPVESTAIVLIIASFYVLLLRNITGPFHKIYDETAVPE